MTGCADWCFIDYNRGYAPDIEQSGSLDVYRLPKPKFYFFQSQMDPEKMPVLYAVHDELSKLLIFSNGDEVEIRKNGNLLLTRKPDNGPDTPYGKKASPNYETAVLSGNDTSVDEYFNGGNVSKLAHPPFTIKDFPPIREGEEYHILAKHNGKVIAETFLRKPGKVESVHTQLRTEGIEIQNVKGKISEKLLAEGDVLLCTAGSFRCALVPKEAEGCAYPQSFVALTPDTTKISSQELYDCLRQESVLQAIRGVARGTVCPRVSVKDLLELELPLPEKK